MRRASFNQCKIEITDLLLCYLGKYQQWPFPSMPSYLIDHKAVRTGEQRTGCGLHYREPRGYERGE